MALRGSELNYGSDILKRLSAMYKDGRFSDINLKIGHKRTLRAHRVVLASFSPYFEALLGDNWKEGKEDEIEILGLDETALSDLIEYAYSGHITISKDNVQALLEAANFLGVELVKQSCANFLKHSMDDETCLGVWQLADMFALKELRKAAKRYALRHFVRVCKLEEFMSLPSGFLTELLADEELCVVIDDLIPCAEEREKIVLQAVFGYIEHDEENRRSLLPKLLPLVRLLTLSGPYLKEIMTHRLVILCDSCAEMFERAQKLKMDSYEKDSSDGKWMVPRKFAKYTMTWVASSALYDDDDDKLGQSAIERRMYLDRLKNLNTDLYVTGMEIWIQHQDGISILKHFKVYYNDDSTHSFRVGHRTYCLTDSAHNMEHYEFHLKENERIVKVEMCVNSSQGNLKELTFYTNKKNASGQPKRYGPYGDYSSGGRGNIAFNSMKSPESYGFLAGLYSDFTVDFTGYSSHNMLQFAWRSYVLPGFNDDNNETPPPLPPRPMIRIVHP